MEAVMTGGEAFREAMEVAIPPCTEAFAPDVVVISVHFDGHNRDSLGNLNLVEADYAWVTRSLTPRASRSAQYGAERP
jgi:acetoin utilization deacetylase AcuC-like enzyme